MTTFNVYEAKTHFSKLLSLVENGEQVVIARNGKPLADITKHTPRKKSLVFGAAAGKITYTDDATTGTDADIQAMFYGKSETPR